jgi:hypothetical protein
MTTYLPANALSAFLQTYRNFEGDTEQIRILLNNSYRDTAEAVNVRTIGTHDLVEVQNGEQYFNPTNTQNKRYAFRKTFSIGAIATGATNTFNHDITGISIVTHFYGGVITDVPDYRPLPNPSTTANANIDVIVTNTQISITNGAGSPNITGGILVIEYLKN